MFDSFKRSFGTILGTVAGLAVGSYILAKLNTHEIEESKDEKEDFVEETN